MDARKTFVRRLLPVLAFAMVRPTVGVEIQRGAA
jgi:hypothetical protein